MLPPFPSRLGLCVVPAALSSALEISMSTEDVQSEALYRATLNSEWYRIVGLLGLLVALMVYAIARAFALQQFGLLLALTLVFAFVITHEAIMLLVIRRALQHGRDVPPVAWLLNVLIESQLPTVALFLLLVSQWMTPVQVLVAPAVLAYFLFIILSTLRLSPGLSVLTGLASAIGYLGVTADAAARIANSQTQIAAFPRGFYFSYAGLILAGGVIAAVVAGQIRGYVAAALREAALESELKAVNHDLDIARSIQQGLLPSRVPGLEAFDVAGWNQPADQTGGDYFDWQTLPDGRVAVSLGDATGHGIGPALVMASCRAYARASLLVGGRQNGVLNRLNQLLVEDLPANRFVTFVVALLDPTTSNIEVLSAGHGPILWYRYATDKIESLDAQGVPLGMFAGAKYEHGTECRLEKGDTLVLITDGFYEWENPHGEQFGIARLEAVIRAARDCKPDEAITRLREAVETFCEGTKQQDDLTAVLLRRNF